MRSMNDPMGEKFSKASKPAACVPPTTDCVSRATSPHSFVLASPHLQEVEESSLAEAEYQADVAVVVELHVVARAGGDQPSSPRVASLEPAEVPPEFTDPIPPWDRVER